MYKNLIEKKDGERGHLEDIGIDGIIIVRWMLV
jgi:hypothetical protein